MAQADGIQTAGVENADLGLLLFETTAASDDTGLAFFLLLPQAMLVPFTVGIIERGNYWLAILLAVASMSFFSGAGYFYLRRLHWYCFQNGVVERTRWTARIVAYGDVTALHYSLTRQFNDNGNYNRTVKELRLTTERRTRPVRITASCREQIELATDPMIPTVVEEIRDRVAALVADRMASQLDSGCSVPWTRRARLLREGIEIIGWFGWKELVQWNRFSGASVDESVCRLWGERPTRPVVKIRTDETNFYPGYQLALQHIPAGPKRDLDDVLGETRHGKRQCPACGVFVDSLKKYRFLQIVFLGFHVEVKAERIAACPRCMRRYLVVWGLCSLLATNVLWPFFVLPLFAARVGASFRRGHSVQEVSFARELGRDVANLRLIGSVMIAGVTSVFFAFGQSSPGLWMSSALAGSIVAFPLFAWLGAIVDL